MSDRNTINVYNREAGRYAELTDAHNAEDPRLAKFIAQIPPQGSVLDLGCGPGVSAAAMARAGLSVDAIDASPEMIKLAGLHAGVTARLASFDDIRGGASYDGIWANFSLLHAPANEFPSHLSAIRQALKPSGIFFIGMKLGSGEGPDRLGRYYSYYKQDELEAILKDAGFFVVERVTGRGTGLDGSVSDWISIFARVADRA
ncbi:class I SAM-dependent methyltransferase [Primorskyibacter sp. S87]|uniref:class I SAM-dependent methyltransferase n=1 Tax=Primorskyibacter sp. S87 TaxID=3415126 RepID=UPI003C7B5868